MSRWELCLKRHTQCWVKDIERKLLCVGVEQKVQKRVGSVEGLLITLYCRRKRSSAVSRWHIECC
jgi:hypothetical protein